MIINYKSKYIFKDLKFIEDLLSGIRPVKEKEPDFGRIKENIFREINELPTQDELKRVYQFHKVIAGLAILVLYLYVFI